MKRILTPFLCLIFLCGCHQKPQEYLVTAIGVDVFMGEYVLTVESVIINTETDSEKRQTLTGKGRTLDQAFNDIEKQTTMPLMLSHCGIIIVGKTISRTTLKGIMRYCKERGEITLSAYFIKTENAALLLEKEPISSISVGYDLMAMIKTNNMQNSTKIKNRLFEICENENPILPLINLTEKGYYFDQK
jgi:hypothetical protein